ncbi:MAG: lytic transglycosylase domain-containing protein [Marinobacter sp.]|nr:lytic transglycosylase domain-containing protein [Marinobacter sp.]
MTTILHRQSKKRRLSWPIAVALTSLLPLLSHGQQREDWTQVVRETPYWMSQGVHDNIVTIRQWVLRSSSYCSEPQRHILYDRRGRFLTWLSNSPSREQTQQRLNDVRQRLVSNGRSDVWVEGAPGRVGYPFALACDQPHVDLPDALARYLGQQPSDRIWGTWDDLSLGTQDAPIPLHDALLAIYQKRVEQQRLSLPPELPRYLAGTLLIESGARTRARSSAGAIGIMQLMEPVLNDCGIPRRSHWHRMAQLDCAMRLTQQNARNLRPAFDTTFGHLPDDKQDRLFTLLLIQAYHGGAGRVIALLQDPELSKAATYFAEHHERFSAGDIAFGLVFHNLGRNRFGLASLYYVADIQLATEALCQTARLKGTDFCID